MSILRFTATSPCIPKYHKEKLAFGITKLEIFRLLLRYDEDLNYLGINYEYFSFWDSDLKVAEFISISVSKTSIERIAIRREE